MRKRKSLSLTAEDVVQQLKDLRKKLNRGEIDRVSFESEKERLLSRRPDRTEDQPPASVGEESGLSEAHQQISVVEEPQEQSVVAPHDSQPELSPESPDERIQDDLGIQREIVGSFFDGNLVAEESPDHLLSPEPQKTPLYRKPVVWVVMIISVAAIVAAVLVLVPSNGGEIAPVARSKNPPSARIKPSVPAAPTPTEQEAAEERLRQMVEAGVEREDAEMRRRLEAEFPTPTPVSVQSNAARSSRANLKTEERFDRRIPSSWRAVSDVWVVQNGHLTQTSYRPNTRNGIFYEPGRDFTNYSVEAEIWSDGWYHCCSALMIYVRYHDFDNCYFVQLHSSGDIELLVRRQGKVQLIEKVAVGPSLRNRSRIKVVADGSNFKIYRDGTMTLSTRDATFQSGTFGFESIHIPGYVDNVVVESLNESKASSGGHVRRSFRVIRVRYDDTLNIRSRPDPSAPIVAEIPPDGTGVVWLGRKQAVRGRSKYYDWFEVKYRGTTGWVNSHFLEAE